MQNNPFNWSINDTTHFTISSGGVITNKTTLALGNYNINISITDDDNNINSSVWLLVVSKRNGVVYTYIKGERQNMNINRSSVWLNGSLIIGKTNISLYKDGVLAGNGSTMASNYSLFDSCGEFNITSIYDGDENYTSASETWFVTVEQALQNTTWSVWYDNETCVYGQSSHSIRRNLTQYDVNDCGGYSNETIFEYDTALCSCIRPEPGNDWIVPISDNCTIDYNLNLGSGKLIIQGGGWGTFTVFRNIRINTSDFQIKPLSFKENYSIDILLNNFTIRRSA